MSVFTASEREYLESSGGKGSDAPRLARLATVGPDGTPHVVPVGFTYNPRHDSIEIGGRNFARSKKYRDVARTGRAAVVVDDLASVNPWRPRGIEVRGRAEAIDGDRPRIRVHPERIVPWGLEQDGRARTIDR